MGELRFLTHAVFYYEQARFFGIVEDKALEKSVNAQGVAENFKRVYYYRHLFDAVDLVAVIEHAQLPAARRNAQLVAALHLEQKVLMIEIHIRMVQDNAVIDSVKQSIYPADRQIEFLLRIAVGQQNILSAFPVDIVEIERLKIERHMSLISAEHLLPHSHGVLEYIIGVALPSRCAAGSAQIQVFRMAAKAYFELVAEYVEAVFLILMESERGVKENVLARAEVLDADVHRRLGYIAVYRILKVVYPGCFEKLVSVVQSEFFLAVIRYYFVGYKIDLVKVLVEEIRYGIQSIVG